MGIRSLADEWMGFAIAGPCSRELLARVAADDVSTEAFPFLSWREMKIAGLAARIARISFTGERGYEIWVAAGDQVSLYDALLAAGGDLGLKHFGARALHSMRLEKSFGNWAREFRPIYTPAEAGLERFVDLDKPDFIGRAAAARERETGPARRLVTFVVDAADADATGDEPVWQDGKVVGWVTSGGYGHCVSASIALGYVPSTSAITGGRFEIEIMGERRAATLASTPLYDPAGERMRRS